MTSILHDVGVQFFSETFTEARKRQQETSGKLPWRWGRLLRSRLEDGSSNQVTKSASKYVADITVQDQFNDALFLLEARTQSWNDTITKINERLANNPKLCGAVVISISELPVYKHPGCKSTDDDALIAPLWAQAVERSPKLGPIEYRSFRWMGKITCSLDIRLKGSEQPRAQHIVSLIHIYTYFTDQSSQ
jgi:hypothetical protein